MREVDPKGSLYALGALRHDIDSERDALEAAAAQFIEDAEQAKWAPALSWFENVSYLCGNHMTQFYRQGGSLRTHTFGVDSVSQHDDLLAQSCDNRLIRPFETVTGMLTQTKPKPRVAPNSPEIDDEDAAKISELVVDLTFENPLEMPQLRQEAAAIAMICGSAFAETEYGDTDLPEPTPRIVERKVPEDEYRPGMPETELVEDGEDVAYRRDMQCHLWTPFHFSADPRATKMRQAVFFIRSNFEDLFWLQEQYDKDEEGYYPQALDALGDTEASRYPLYWWSRIQDILASPQYWQSTGLSSRRWAQMGGAANHGFTSVIDVKPSRMFPRGRTLILVNKKLVYCGEQARAWSEKYKWRWHGYSDFHWLKLPGRFLGVPLLSEILPHQKRINSIDAIVRINREHLAIGQYKIARQSRVAEGSITGIAGQHIMYTAVPNVPEPHRVEHVPLPSELLQEREDLIRAIDNIAATGVIGGEMAASSARAGVMLDFLREERLRSKGPMLTSFEKFLESIGQNVLIEYQLGLTEGDPELTARLQVAAKQYSSLSIASFTGASLRDHHAVKIDIASELLTSPEAKKEMAGMALQFAGPNATPQMLSRIFNAMGLGEIAETETTASVERARRMIQRVRMPDWRDPQVPDGLDPMVTAALLGFMPGIDQWAVLGPVFREHILSEQFNDHPNEVKKYLLRCFDTVTQLAQAEAMQMMQVQMQIQAQQDALSKPAPKEKAK